MCFKLITCCFSLLQIVCVRDGSMGRLTIDRLTEFEDVAQANNVAWRVSDSLFVGGVPPGKAQRNIQVRVTVYRWYSVELETRTACK